MTAAQYTATVARLRRRADRAQTAAEYDAALAALAAANRARAAAMDAEPPYVPTVDWKSEGELALERRVS
jgi:hypothetical protein